MDRYTHTHGRTHALVHKFLHWYEHAPWIITIWATPLVIVLWLAAIVKELIQKGSQTK